MGNRKSVFLGGAILVLLIVSFLIYSEITAQVGSDALTQGEFANLLVQVLGIELPLGVSDWGEVSYLWMIKEPLENYAPPGGWGAAGDTFTTEGIAYVFGQILDLPLPATSFLSQLQGMGLLVGANPTDNFTLDDLIGFVDDLSDAVEDGNIQTDVNLFRIPVSPTT